MSETVIKLRDVSKYYKLYDTPLDRLKESLSPFGLEYHKKHYALKSVSLTVKKGELLGIIGKNGCGKSTLLKMISSVLIPDSGNVKVYGRVSALLELGSGFNPEFTGLNNIYFYGMILGLDRKEVDSILDDIISFADIGEYINQPLKSYSSGMKARLGFSVATAIQPEILILDEVLAVGDAQFRKKSAIRMHEMMNSGCTVLLVSHSEDSINRLCTRAVYIRDGEVVISGLPKNVTRMYLKVTGSDTYITNDEIRSEFKYINSNLSDDSLSDVPVKASNVDEAFYSDVIQKYSQPIVLNNFPIELVSIEIFSGDDKKVNILNHGETYRLVLSCLFSKEVENIVLPIAIYASNGQLLAGVRYPGSGGKMNVASGSKIEVICEFSCTFLPGIFYISAGVTQLGDGEKNYLLRVDDALSFKVQDNTGEEHWGMFSPFIRHIDDADITSSK